MFNYYGQLNQCLSFLTYGIDHFISKRSMCSNWCKVVFHNQPSQTLLSSCHFSAILQAVQFLLEVQVDRLHFHGGRATHKGSRAHKHTLHFQRLITVNTLLKWLCLWVFCESHRAIQSAPAMSLGPSGKLAIKLIINFLKEYILELKYQGTSKIQAKRQAFLNVFHRFCYFPSLSTRLKCKMLHKRCQSVNLHHLKV